MALNRFDIEAVLFDFDGTLTKPGAIDFSMIRTELGCPMGIPILEFIDTLVTPEEKQKALSTLDCLEMEAAVASTPNRDAEDAVTYLKGKGLPIGIISRNSLASIERSLKNFDRVGAADFDLIVSRDLPVKPKPHPDGILFAAGKLHIPVDRILMVGDFVFDIQAGRAAGAKTVLISNGNKNPSPGIDSDAIITRLQELKSIV
jgi:hydrogenase expression/formation protein HypE